MGKIKGWSFNKVASFKRKKTNEELLVWHTDKINKTVTKSLEGIGVSYTGPRYTVMVFGKMKEQYPWHAQISGHKGKYQTSKFKTKDKALGFAIKHMKSHR